MPSNIDINRPQGSTAQLVFNIVDDEGNVVDLTGWTNFELTTYINPAIEYDRTVTLDDSTGGTFSQDIRVIVGEGPVASNNTFNPVLLSTSKSEEVAFKGRGNIIELTVNYSGSPLNLSVFDRFVLYGASETEIDTQVNSDAITGYSSGVVRLDIGSLITKSGLVNTTLVGFNTAHPDGAVIWDEALPKSSLALNIVSTSTTDPGSTPALTNGIRLLLKSRTNNAVLADGAGYTVYLISKNVTLTDQVTDSEGYVLVQDASLDQLGEDIKLAVESPDGNLSGFGTYSVEDLTEYL